MNKFKRKIIALELKASLSSKSLIKKQKIAIEQLQFDIQSKVIEIVAIQKNNVLSKSLALKKFELNGIVEKYFSDLTKSQQKDVSNLLTNIYNQTRIELGNSLGRPFDVTNVFQLKGLLARSESSLTISQRIWHNNAVVSDRVNKDIARLLYNNSNPEDIKRALMNDFNVSYNSADRLIRTESSKFYNSAALDSYKDAGIEYVEFLAEADACEEHCQPNDGKVFQIGTGEVPPLHPNCRCTILPVIN